MLMQGRVLDDGEMTREADIHPIRKLFVTVVTGVCLLAGAWFALWPMRANGQTPESLDMPAPELIGGSWLNTPRNQPIKLASRKGKVTIVEFWTFG